MKRTVFAIVTVAFFLTSCASTATGNYKSVGQAPQPIPETKLVLTFTNDDLIVLGDIDITKKIEWSYNDNLAPTQKNTVMNYGFFWNTNYIAVDNQSYRKSGMSEEEKLVSLIIYEAISRYPDMDYILFPKTEKQMTQSYGTSSEPNSITVRLRGKAVKIDLSSIKTN